MKTESEAWVQISSGQGPAECERAVSRILDHFLAEAKTGGILAEILERVPGVERECLASVLLLVKGKGMGQFLGNWRGTVLWTARSPFRPEHKRKNWYVGIEIFDAPEEKNWKENEVSFETFRGTGPGGQNVNKVSTAVRLIHLPTGLAVVAREERSQYANRKLALARLHALLGSQTRQAEKNATQSRRLNHYRVERGNSIRSFQQPL